MCGITGWVGAPALDDDALRRMRAAIAHRGPDDDAAFVDPGRVALGFRRLSIIDLECGAQPIASESGRVVVTVNGEIYNFQALRDELRARGHTFRTGSDAEVVVHLYEEEGARCLQRLRGMFAIALWDADHNRLLLARDRLGVKPLFYAERGGGLLYGSEPGAILASGAVPARPDLAAIAQYLTLQYVPAPLSGFAGIRKLHPGELLIWENGAVRTERWWTLRHGEAVDRVSDEQRLDELDAVLSEATRLRLIADVPVGAFLSGGVDSSLVVSYMAEHASDVRTFSIDFPLAKFSEGEHAREVARVYGTRHEDLVVEPDVIPVVAEVVRAAGEPFADSSAIPTYLLSEMTRRRVTVALSGDGGDEAFAGYVRHRIASSADRLGRLPEMAAPLARAVERIPGNGRVARLQRGLAAIARTPHERYASIMSHFEPAALQKLCTPEFLAEAGGTRRAWDEVLALDGTPGVDRYLTLDTATYLPGDLLVKVDRMSMWHALEVRSPLLDQEVHELAARTPADMKLRRGETKWLLKQLARRRGLPEHLVTRAKKGFGIPIGEWFRGDLRPWVEGILRDPATRDRGWLRPAEVDRLLDDHLAGRADHTPRLWNLAMLELWQREWIDGR
jgi:asparagine synthase (glutamine-hydrolysing)